jgi:hypothetical protein
MNDLRKKADEADKALAQVEADLNSPGLKDKAKLDAVYQRYIQAKATSDYLKGMTGKQQSGQPAENIDYSLAIGIRVENTPHDRGDDSAILRC